MSIAALDRAVKADSATSMGVAESGQPWVQYRGTWGVISNQFYQPSNVSNSVAGVECNDATFDISVTISAVTAATGYQGLSARIVDLNNFLAVEQGTPGNDNNIYIVKVVAGTATILSTVANTSANGDRLRFVGSGTSLSVFVNSVAKGTAIGVTDGQTATKHGLWSHASASAGRMKDFVALCPTQQKMVVY